MPAVPAHVVAAFGAVVGTVDPEPVEVGRGHGFRVGDVVFTKVENTAESSWLAGTLEQLRVSTIRIARPVRASDGRWVVAGWSAQRVVSGRPEPRYGEIVSASLELHEALAAVPEPRFLRQRTDLESAAERLAWGDAGRFAVELPAGHGARLFDDLAAGRHEVDLRPQVVHGDMFGNVLFAGSAPPAVVDIAPFWRPASWAAAVIVVDALSWGDASTELLGEWEHLPEWPQMVRRALLYRLAVSLLHPRTTPASLVQILSAVEVIRPHLD
ncbi:TIGR02569 family protein [Nakamurella sp. YIM 132087]|uniref:TIGR02569 family protein n=1 Tax=Nakamurella alba TaxID=2665158 RepID=A0A7K1FLA4_9ACTN|nr:TIGR02569 family protein [Nakamurella alba]MTD13664.1 TIGR02569 family protein [Nakamurella alba]